MPGSEFMLSADDGQSLLARRWLPEERPRAVLQIAHGLTEHSGRYARLAAALNAAGYGVYANDLAATGPGPRPPTSAISPTRAVGTRWSATSGPSTA